MFVPTVHMLMSAVVTSTPQALRNSPGAGIVGVPFDVRVDPAWAGVPLRAGDLALRADEQGWVRGLRFDRPGLFDIQSEDGRVVRPVAVNFPPEESRREFFRPAILQRQLEARRRASGIDGDAPRISLASESGWWRWILGALAIVWLAEPWLALRSHRARRPERSRLMTEIQKVIQEALARYRGIRRKRAWLVFFGTTRPGHGAGGPA